MEDEAIVRALVRAVLTKQGYAVVEAADPAEALAICADGRTFDLLFTDVVMPGMSGHELAKRLISGQPSLKVLFCSGYSNDTDVLAGHRTSSKSRTRSASSLPVFGNCSTRPSVVAPVSALAVSAR